MFQKLHRLLICQIIISGQRHAGGSMDKNPHFHKQISGVRASGHSRQIDLIDYISGITVQDLIHAFRLMLTALVTGYKQKFKQVSSRAKAMYAIPKLEKGVFPVRGYRL